MDTHSSTYRLPRKARPTHYALTLSPDLAACTFAGEVAIDLDVCEITDTVTLHTMDLEIHSVCLEAGSQNFTDMRWEIKKEAEELLIHCGKTLSPGSAKLSISFNGVLNDKMHGFYRSTYALPDGSTQTLATTQFEATDARRCFPCFDEPDIPATFDVLLVVSENLEAISNMPIAEAKPIAGDKKSVRFATTPVMSTYLLAFIVGELEHIEAKTKDGTTVRVYTTHGKKEQGRFALDVAVRCLEFYNDYFDIPYPLPKLDMIAVPDFEMGAMENWGAVTYRETALLIDDRQSSAASRQHVAYVVAHELAHQWFGNLVTMDWWTHLWLNEGFATFIGYMAINHIFPEWEIWTQFIAEAYAPALHTDSLRSTHPIEVEVKHPNEISEIFDAVSYEKGASILRMIEVYLGPDIFRDGLRLYLKRYQYKNAATEDLWRALAEVSGKPVASIMDTWTKQPGYPLLTLHRERENTFCIIQSRFLSAAQTLTSEESRQVWRIPVPVGVMGKEGREQTSFLMEERESSAELSHEHGWVKLNAHQVAFLRVNYTPELWNGLFRAVREGELGTIDRFGVVSDLAALVKAGALQTPFLLESLKAYTHEQHFIVWMDIVGVLDTLDNLLAFKPCKTRLHTYARVLLTPIGAQLGWDAAAGESHTVTLLRGRILRALGGYGGKDTIAETLQRFAKCRKNPDSLDPNLRLAVYRIAAENGDTETYDALLELYRKTGFQEEKIRCLRALGNFRDPELLAQTLTLSLSSEIRSQDTLFPIASVGANPLGRRLAWEFFKNNWDEFTRRYGEGGLKLMGRFISSTTQYFTSEDEAEEIEKFFLDHPAPSAARTIQQSLEEIRANAAWLTRDGRSIAEWLAQWKKRSDTV